MARKMVQNLPRQNPCFGIFVNLLNVITKEQIFIEIQIMCSLNIDNFTMDEFAPWNFEWTDAAFISFLNKFSF